VLKPGVWKAAEHAESSQHDRTNQRASRHAGPGAPRALRPAAASSGRTPPPQLWHQVAACAGCHQGALAAKPRVTAQHTRQGPRASPSDTPMPYSWKVIPGSDRMNRVCWGVRVGSNTCISHLRAGRRGAPVSDAARRGRALQAPPPDPPGPVWPVTASAERLTGPPRQREVAGLLL